MISLQSEPASCAAICWSDLACAGAAALMATEYASLTAADLKASMLSSATPVATLQGYSQTGVGLMVFLVVLPCSWPQRKFLIPYSKHFDNTLPAKSQKLGGFSFVDCTSINTLVPSNVWLCQHLDHCVDFVTCPCLSSPQDLAPQTMCMSTRAQHIIALSPKQV